jgi:hypothetical protein
MSERDGADALLVCPFCGCDGGLVDQEYEDEWRVKCNVCRSEGPASDTEALAVDGWNRRHSNSARLDRQEEAR